MNEITYPLKLRMKSPEVGNLQDALKLLLDRLVILDSVKVVGLEVSFVMSVLE